MYTKSWFFTKEKVLHSCFKPLVPFLFYESWITCSSTWLQSLFNVSIYSRSTSIVSNIVSMHVQGTSWLSSNNYQNNNIAHAMSGSTDINLHKNIRSSLVAEHQVKHQNLCQALVFIYHFKDITFGDAMQLY